jgi:hypothetical protein
MDYLAERVHARIGAPGANAVDGGISHARERALHHVLQGLKPRLELPAGVRATVVLEAGGKSRHLAGQRL